MTTSPGPLASGDDDVFVKPGELVVDQPVLSTQEREQFQEAILIGRRTGDFGVFGHQVSLSTLTMDLELQVSKVVAPWENTQGFVKAYKLAVVAAALNSIDGSPFYSLLQPADEDRIVELKFKKLKSYYPLFVDELYKRVTELEKGLLDLVETLGKSDG